MPCDVLRNVFNLFLDGLLRRFCNAKRRTLYVDEAMDLQADGKYMFIYCGSYNIILLLGLERGETVAVLHPSQELLVGVEDQ